MSAEENIAWRQVENSKHREPVLVGHRVAPDWLSGQVGLQELRLVGKTRQAFDDLFAAARDASLNLPIMSLRTAMIVALDGVGGVVSVDRDLGLSANLSGDYPAAVQMTSHGIDEDREVASLVREVFCDTVQQWVRHDVLEWAEANGLGDVAARLIKMVSAGDIELSTVRQSYIPPSGRPNYSLIAQVLGRRLSGEKLFDGLGVCELVAFSEPGSNVVELMTQPVTMGRDVFSMVARVRISSIPYSNDVFLSVTAVKRVWAKKVPKAYANMPRSVLGYVVASGRPVTPVVIRRTETGWVFGDEYASLLRASDAKLPATLEDAIAQREFNAETGWWAGLPELPSLFRSLSPRTVFEGDEIALLATVSNILSPIVSDRPVSVREIRRPASLSKPLQEMLRISDFGAAGAGFVEQETDDDGPDEVLDEREALAERQARIEAYRAQNVLALKRSRGDAEPIVWMIGGEPDEVDLTRQTIRMLFGETVKFSPEPLPAGVHGLRANLDGADRIPARARFEKRVAAWAPYTKLIREKSGDRPAIVLVCARDRYDNKPEDPVNYYAGIHAMSLIGANVHYVLPMDAEDSNDERQNFVHRLQSALLDVLLAHPGLVFGVKEFVEGLLPAEMTPKAVYGIQAVRSRARSMSGESNVCFVLFSRLLVETGMTEIKVIYRAGKNASTDWMPLSDGLNWVGQMRSLQESDEKWLRNNFTGIVRDELVRISENDPHAVVMIDWTTVRSLWKGIRDEDLSAGKPPLLDDKPLTMLTGMTFIRLRRGDNVMSLRDSKSSVFKAWKRAPDGSAEQLGEQHVESYLTTKRNIIEVLPASGADVPSATGRHYIVSMGYAKTVQIIRGLSCYRTVSRMKKDDAGFYRLTRKAPATVDAALPAPMDVTVMSCPDGVSPDLYATLVTGLRLGYAHFNDWTGLPAPLFFRRKVDDYIIRYSEEGESAIDIPDRNEVVMPEGTQASQDLVDEVVAGTAAEIATPVEEASAPTANTEESEWGTAADTEIIAYDAASVLEAIGPDFTTPAAKDALVSEMKSCVSISLSDLIRDDSRLFRGFHRVISGVASHNEAIHMRIALPWWVNPRTALVAELPVSKKSVRRCWDFMVDYGYVGNRIKRPSEESFLGWLGQFLAVPQSCVSLASITRPLGGLMFRPVVEMLEKVYLPTLPEGQTIDLYHVRANDFGPAMKWGCETENDDFVAWLIFTAAQYTAPRFVSAVIDNLTCLPGQKSVDAALYYLYSHAAISRFVTFKGGFNKFPPIHDKPPYVSSRPETIVSPPAAPAPQVAAPIVREAPAPVIANATTDLKEQDPFMAAKESIHSLLDELLPGSDTFDATLDDIRGVLEKIKGMHEEALTRQMAESEAAKRLGVLVERQTSLLESIVGEQEELMISSVEAKPLSLEVADAADADLFAIESALMDLEGRRAQVDYEASRPATTVAERRQVMVRKAAAETAFFECVERIHELLVESVSFSVVIPNGDTPPPNDGGGIDSEKADGANPTVPAAPVAPVKAPAVAVAEPVAVQQNLFAETKAAVVTEPVAAPVAASVPPSAIAVPKTEVKPEPQQKAVKVETPAVASPHEDRHHPSALLTSATSNENFDSHVAPLRQLIDQRLYGLAEVHVAALGHMADELGDEVLTSQHAILQALVGALDGMDCQFSFDMRLNDGLNHILSAERLPTCCWCDPAAMALGILAAGIGNLLFDESDVRWRIGSAVSARLQEYDALSKLVSHIDTIRQRGYVITRDAFIASRVGDKVAIQRELVRFQRLAAEWKHSHEIHSNFNHKGFKRLHEEMFSPKSPIGACLAAIASGDASKARALFDESHHKFRKASATVDDMWKKIDRGQASGLYRQQVINNIETTGRFIQSYLEQVDRGGQQKSDLPRDTNEFLTRLDVLLRDAIAEVATMEYVSETSSLYAAAAVKAMNCVLRLYDTKDVEVCISNEKQKLLVQLPLGRDLMPTMGTKDGAVPSLCSPAEVLSETSRWAEANLSLDGDGGGEDINAALKDAFDRHLDAKRFLPAFLIERQIRALLGSSTPLQKRYNTEREALQAELQDARQRVTHAMTLSALPVEAETSRMQRIIEELLSLVRLDKTIGHCDADSDAYPDFPQARGALRAFVLNPLEDRLAAAKEKLICELNDEAAKGVSPTDIERIQRMLDSNNAATLRTAHDALGILKQSGKLPAYPLSSSFNMAGEYETFMKRVHEATVNKPLIDGTLSLLKADLSESSPEWLTRLDADQRATSVELLTLWAKFFERQSLSDQDLTERLFRQMGMPQIPIAIPESGRSSRGKLSFPDRAFVFPTTAEDPLFIPPSLGSWGSHVEGFVLYGSVNENQLRLVLQETNGTPTIIFARTKLSMAKREALTRNLPALIVDDELIVYMALHPNEMFQSMMKVGMLTYANNPYDDYDSQPVPPEMFFGRHDELRMLHDVKSLAVLFGGRRLGKSSLLAQVEHDENKKSEHYAVLVSMQTVDIVGDHVMAAWEFICNQLVRRKIIPPMASLARDWKDVVKHIEAGLMEAKSVKGLYLLIDEADNLMGRELKVRPGEPRFVETLVQFMNDLAHVCKVRSVIAGLHNVTRMSNEENTVFGKTSTIPLKPFSTSEDIGRGIRLITKPLAAMGYLFKEAAQDLPLRILAVCNFYPAFVQLYCKRLVERLQNNRQTAEKPPMYITAADLDAVEADSALLMTLRRKFEYNLDLDKRYKVIALALADTYYTEIDSGHYKGLTIAEIREYCEVYGGARFEGVSSGVYEALLDEMMKLNVVERVGTRYVLRNPQIAMMIGDRERIQSLLNDISRDPPDQVRSHGERRSKMVHGRQTCEFPMPIAWVRRQMDPSDGELVIMPGNALSGIQDLIQMDRHAWTLRDDYSVLPVPGVGPDIAINELDRLRRKPLGTIGRMLVVRPAGWHISQIKEYVSVAKKAQGRIVLLADPVRAFDLMQAFERMSDSGALGAESERGWRVEPVLPWSEDAVFFRVSENGENLAVADSRDALSAILKASCGFGNEVTRLCTATLSVEQAMGLPEVRRRALAPDLNTFYRLIGLPQSFLEPHRRQMEDFLYFINGLDRHGGGVEEAMSEYHVSPWLFEYLRWMGLVQEGVKNSWAVPELYLDLLSTKKDA